MQPIPESSTPAGHPPGLWVLFITEMWERFSYYGMRALLVLYLIAESSEVLEDGRPNTNAGFGWSEESAYLLYGIYTWAVYLTPIFGGWLADRFLGTHRSMLVGGWIIAAGHITLAATEFFDVSPGKVVTLQSSPGALICFVTGLALIVVGTGFFKPCVSVMVGQLYAAGDSRRDSGFTIFYMGINLGALFSPLVAGTLGQTVGWHWGFGSAAVGMLTGLFFYQWYRPKYLHGVGEPPAARLETLRFLGTVALWIGGAGAVGAAGYGGFAVAQAHGVLPFFWSGVALLGLFVMAAFVLAQPPAEQGPLAVIFVLSFVGNILFWAAFEQAGSSMNVFAEKSTDRTLGGWLTNGFPASWYQSVNPAAILVFAPVFAWLWVRLERVGWNPSIPAKFALGLYLLGLAFVGMVCGAQEAATRGLAGPHWLLVTYIAYTWGELCLSPVGLSMVTRLAPLRLQSLMMGVWFFSSSLANLVGGLLAAFSKKLEQGEITFILPGLPGFYLLLVLFPLAGGCLITLLTPLLKRMMRGEG